MTDLFKKPIPVLMYHQLNQPDPSTSLVVSPESFSRQIDWLEKKGFRFLSLDEVVDLRGKIPFTERAVALTFDDGFRDNYEKGFSLLIRHGKAAALFVVVNWVGQNGFLNWREIRELAQSGMTIGSHSLTHRWLPDIKNENEMEAEICDSKKRIEDEIGKEVCYFCYPVGGVDARIAEQVRRAGYRAAWVAGGRPSTVIREPSLCFRRIKITPSDSNLTRFLLKAYGVKGLFQKD